MKKYIKKRIDFFTDIFFVIIGTALLAFSFKVFIVPNNIAPGGSSGIAIMISYLFNIQVGVTTFIINIPLIILSFFILGKHFIIKTFISIVSFSLCMDVIFKNVMSYQGDMILAMIFAAFIGGVGSGLIFIRSGSSGGTDIIALILKKRKPHFKTGSLVMYVDLVIILISVFVYKNIEVGMYAILYKVIIGFVIDRVVYGFDQGKMIFINSQNHSSEINEYITKTLSRGVTVIDSRGGYSKVQRDLLLCVVSNRSYVAFRKAIKEIDPDAFVIVTNTSEVIGNGFKSF